MVIFWGGIPKTAFPRKHDVILFYSKSRSKDRTFNIKYKPYSKTTTRHTDGSSLNEKGTPITDTWDDLKGLSLASKERKGYPTQKPQKLLERIIKVSSNKGDLVLDPFCGCGTAVEVAQRLGRNFIAIDVSPIACKLIADGVEMPYEEIEGMPMTRKHLNRMEPHEFQDWVCKIMGVKNTSPNSKKPSGGDGGFDGEIIDPKIKEFFGCPIQVKQSDNVGVNVVRNLVAVLVDKNVNYGFIVAHSFGSGAIDFTSKLFLENKYSITLITTDELKDIHQGDKYSYKENVKLLEEA